MYHLTARNIALISPMRQRFNALSAANSFAGKIIEKYSETEPFPFSGEALVFLKALGDKLREEQSLRDDVSYTLRLLIVHRLLVDGKVADPTVGKNYLTAVSKTIERNISRLRMTDNNAYIRMTDARPYIENSAEIGDIILNDNITADDRSFVYSFAETRLINDRFFGSNSSYAYSGVYDHIPVHDLIYKKEKVGEDTERIGDFLLPGVSNNVVNNETAGDNEYSYNSENLTYKTENNITETNGIISGQSVRNYIDNSEKLSDLSGIGLLVMNSFLSGGSQYISSVKEKYIHKPVTLSRNITMSREGDKIGTAERIGVIADLTSLERLFSDRTEMTDEERRIYDTVVRTVYLEQHGDKQNIPAGKMLEKMSIAERTKALSLIIDRYTKAVQSGAVVAPSVEKNTLSAEKNDNSRAPSKGDNCSTIERIRTAIVNVISHINSDQSDSSNGRAEAFRPSSSEMRLLTFRTGKSGIDAKSFTAASDENSDLSLQLGRLYFTLTDVSAQQRIIADRVKQAAEIPYRTKLVPIRRRYAKTQPDQHSEVYKLSNGSIYNDEHTVINNMVESDKEIPNSQSVGIVNGREVGDRASAAKLSQETVYLPTEYRFTKLLNTVNNLLERIAARKNAFETIKSSNGKDGKSTTGKDDTGRSDAAAQGSTGDVYEGAQYSFAFTDLIKAYMPAGIASDNRTIIENMNLLPVQGYDNIILPASRHERFISKNKAAERMKTLPTQKHITKYRSINLISKRIMQGISETTGTGGRQADTEAVQDMLMPQPEHKTVTLHYHASVAADRNDLNEFYPFGEHFGLFDEVYFGSVEVLSKRGAKVTVSFDMSIVEVPIENQFDDDGINWKWIANKKDFKETRSYKIAITSVIWEYFNGTGWSRLFPDSTSADLFSIRQGVTSSFRSMTFTCPEDIEEIFVGAHSGYYIRARILKAENLYKTKGWYLAPLVRNISFEYHYENNGCRISDILTYNNLSEQRFDPVDAAKVGFAPFINSGSGNRTVFFGFSSPPDKGPFRILWDIEEGCVSPRPKLIWNYLTDSGWKPMNMVDETEGFSKVGSTVFLDNQGFCRSRPFGEELYWIAVSDTEDAYRNKRAGLPVVNGICLNTVMVSNVDSHKEEYFAMNIYSENAELKLASKDILELDLYMGYRFY